MCAKSAGAARRARFWRGGTVRLLAQQLCNFDSPLRLQGICGVVPCQQLEREVHPAAVRCDCCTRTTKCGCTLHPPPLSARTPHDVILCTRNTGVAGIGREGQILGMVEFLAEMVHSVDLFRPKLRPWLGRSSVQREAGRASCAGAAATLGPQTSFCEASQCGRQG